MKHGDDGLAPGPIDPTWTLPGTGSSLLTAGDTDHLFPIDGVRSFVEKAQHRYTQEGVPERFQAILFSSGHSLPDEVKGEAYGLLDRWLK